MKKNILSILLIMMITLCLTGCGEEEGLKDTLWTNAENNYSIKFNADGTCNLMYDGKDTNGDGYLEKSFHTKMHNAPIKCTVEYNKNNTGRTAITMCGSDGKDCITSDTCDTCSSLYFNYITWYKQ